MESLRRERKFEDQPLPTHSQPGLARLSGFEFVSGSPDQLADRLAKMQNHAINKGTSAIISGLRRKDEFDINQNCVYAMMRSLSLEEALELTEKCHFFLNDIYFPYDIRLMKLQLTRLYRPITCFTHLLQEETSYFKPLVLLTIALGKRYFGEEQDELTPIIMYALSLVSPVTKLRSKTRNYLLVSVYTLASFYFRSVNEEDDAIMYSNLALEYAAHIGLHQSEKGLSVLESQTKSRIIWVSFAANRTLSAKMGNPFLLSFDDITREMPDMRSYDEEGTLIDDGNHCPSAEEFRSYLELTCVTEEICRAIYKNVPSTEDLGSIIQHLISWNSSLPENYKYDLTLTSSDRKHKRLIFSLHLNYCFCINLTTIPILYSLVEKKTAGQYHAADINGNLMQLITICMNAAEMTISILMSCYNQEMLATFGVMDLDYIYSSTLSCFMCGEVLGLLVARSHKLLGSALFLLQELTKAGNSSAKRHHESLEVLIEAYRIQSETASEDGEVSWVSPNQNWLTDLSMIETFQGLTDSDMSIWADGSRNFPKADSYWDDFQRNQFDSL